MPLYRVRVYATGHVTVPKEAANPLLAAQAVLKEINVDELFSIGKFTSADDITEVLVHEPSGNQPTDDVSFPGQTALHDDNVGDETMVEFCEGCQAGEATASGYPGILRNPGSGHIERCDTCCRYPSDAAAAGAWWLIQRRLGRPQSCSARDLLSPA